MTQDLFKTVTSQWVAPTEFPRIEKRVAIDLETCDPELVKHGPGWPAKRGKVIGIAMIKEPYCKASSSGTIEIDGNSLALKVCDLPFI